MNNIELKPISELLEEQFYISSYQRGYRWTQRQIDDLLSDIYTFAKKKRKSEKEFYCLQPIIVKKHTWVRAVDKTEVVGWDVVDGQQRLTTIRLIFKYLIDEFLAGRSLKQRYGNDLYSIEYQTRPGSCDYLDNANRLDDSNIDFYHMGKAYEYISNWFAKMVADEKVMFDDLCDSIIKTLVYNKTNQKEEGIVQVIWYELKDENTKPIDTFIRINLGKISLTNSELIKALFLQERNFGEGDAAKLKQLQIATEWDQMENMLQGDEFWWFLNKNENTASSHIEFIFDIMRRVAITANPKLSTEIGTDHFTTFRYFNSLFGDRAEYQVIKENWDDVKKYFNTFVEWFEKPEWYHYIGFLIYCGEDLQGIFDIVNDSNTKDDVTDELITVIKNKYLSKVKWVQTNSDPVEYNLDINYHSDKELLRRVFLLFNIEYIVNKSKHHNLIYKFPFKAFKLNSKSKEAISWDIEHVDSATENTLKKEEDRIIWLNNALLDVPEIVKNEELYKAINDYIHSSVGDFEQLFAEVRILTGEVKLSEEAKNSLGNLTLLDAGTNRGYGNALFATKRKIIIDKDRNGVFMPICTKNVFLKYFDGNSTSRWTIDDVTAYNSAIENTLAKFLNKKPVPHEQI
jgi:hypothetical protein